jgi:hypothetical protein
MPNQKPQLTDDHAFNDLDPRAQAAVMRWRGIPLEATELEKWLRMDLPGHDIAVFPTHINGNRSEIVCRIEGAWLHCERVNAVSGEIMLTVPDEVVELYDILREAGQDTADHHAESHGY